MAAAKSRSTSMADNCSSVTSGSGPIINSPVGVAPSMVSNRIL